MDNLELTDDVAPEKEENKKKLKGLDSFLLKTDLDIEMTLCEIPEPVLKSNKKPVIFTVRKKNAIF